MTNEEMARLIHEGQSDLLGNLYIQNRGIIYQYAKGYYNRNFERLARCGVELDDMMDESFLILPEAVKAYCESDAEYKFTSFLKYPLLNLFNTLSGLRTKTARQEPLNLSVSLDAPIGEAFEDLTVGDTVADERAEFEENILRDMTLSGVFGAAKEALCDSPKHFEALYMRYGLNMTQAEMAVKLDCSGSYVQQLIRQAMRMLRGAKQKKIRSYAEEIIGFSYHLSGFSRFESTGYSSVEWAVERILEHSKNMTD